MRRFLFIPLIVLSMAFVFAACAKDGGTYGDMSNPESMASSLWSKIQGENYRANWKFWPGKKALYKGQHPHGAFLTSYVNDSAYSSIRGKKGDLPNGAILIKENYMPNKMLGAITVMQKIKGYNPSAGDWFWVKFAPDGKPMTKEMNGMTMVLAGKVGGCIGCHTGQIANDFIFTSPVK